MLTVAEAWRRVVDALPDFGSERVAVEQSAGRILRESVAAERDQPPFDRVMMDGVAIRLRRGERRYRIQAVQHAGDPVLALQSDSDCIEVMTGAVLPTGTDTVVPVERYQRDGGYCVLEAGYDPEPRQFVHPRASDHLAGTVLLTGGTAIGPAEVAVLAAQGLRHVSVGHLPPVAVVSTGDELVAAGEPIADHQIRMSNGQAVLAALLQHGFGDSCHRHFRDDREALRTGLSSLLDTHPVLILSGGVSRGRADYVPAILAELGVEQVFHRVAQRPGKPLWFGLRGQRNLVFALPGNPVSTLVCFRRYALPALLLGTGLRSLPVETISLAAEFEFGPELACFLPVRTVTGADGRPAALPVMTNTSGDFSSLAGTTGFVELPAGKRRFPAGTGVPLYRWRML